MGARKKSGAWTQWSKCEEDRLGTGDVQVEPLVQPDQQLGGRRRLQRLRGEAAARRARAPGGGGPREGGHARDRCIEPSSLASQLDCACILLRATSRPEN